MNHTSLIQRTQNDLMKQAKDLKKNQKDEISKLVSDKLFDKFSSEVSSDHVGT